MNILMVLTSHDQLGDTGKKTGFWVEEFAAPYYMLKEAGAAITLASPKGGQPPLDPKSDEPKSRPNQRNASGQIRRRRRRWPTRKSLPMCRPPSSTPSSIPAAMARCGTCPTTRLHRAHRSLREGRQASRGGMPRAGRAAQCKRHGRQDVSGEQQEGDRVHE